MTAQLRDYYVTYDREERIGSTALEWYDAGNCSTNPDFNIVNFIEQTLIRRLSKKKGKLEIRFFDMTNEQDHPAYVTIDPLTLHVDREIWQLAKIGDPFARHVLAHEVGHIVLHGQYEKAAF